MVACSGCARDPQIYATSFASSRGVTNSGDAVAAVYPVGQSLVLVSLVRVSLVLVSLVRVSLVLVAEVNGLLCGRERRLVSSVSKGGLRVAASGCIRVRI